MIEKLWKKFVTRESVTYILFGILTTAVDWIVYTVLWRLGADYRISTAVSWVAAVLFAFVTNKLFVFQSMELGARLLWREFVSFVAARAATGAFTMVAMIVMVGILHLNEFLGKLVVSAISLVLNYLFSKWFIFKKPEGKGTAEGAAENGADGNGADRNGTDGNRAAGNGVAGNEDDGNGVVGNGAADKASSGGEMRDGRG